jgi:hypothetical protein
VVVYFNLCVHGLVPIHSSLPLSLFFSVPGGEASVAGGGGAGSLTIKELELTTTTTRLHTKTTTIGPPPHKQLAVGGAFPGGGGVALGEPTVGGAMPGQWSGMGVGQSSNSAGVQSQKKALIQYRMYNTLLEFVHSS